MFDELYPAERDASLAQSAQRPPEPERAPGAFQGFGGALVDTLPYAGYTSASAWSAILDAYGKAAAFRDAPLVAAVNGQPAPDMRKVQRETIEQMGNSPVARGFREKAKDYAPDPAAVGTAGQIAHGVLSNVGKAVAYSPAGPAGPVLFGADVGINRAQELSDQGVDGGTAALAGTVSAVSAAVGMRLPAAMGATRLQSAVIGGVVNPALAVAEVGGIHALLQHADYDKIAAQYQPFDPVNLTIAALTGTVFGGAFHRAKAPAVDAPARLSPDEHAALLTMHEVRVRDGDALVRTGDLQAASVAHEAQIVARQQLDAGEVINVAHRVDTDPAQVAAIAQRVRNTVASEAPDALEAPRMDLNPSPEAMALPDAGNPATAVLQPADAAMPAEIVEKVREVMTRMLGQDQAAQVDARPAPATPEQTRAQDIAARNPDAVVRLDDGTDVRMADLIRHADTVEAQAKTETAAFKAAVNCALRFPQ
ncbi:MAG: hypothetical protein K0B16_08485 [Burkholderiaceae bacterium]|nr:hypothetical protein [Burkholderiaceae bacterium]